MLKFFIIFSLIFVDVFSCNLCLEKHIRDLALILDEKLHEMQMEKIGTPHEFAIIKIRRNMCYELITYLENECKCKSEN